MASLDGNISIRYVLLPPQIEQWTDEVLQQKLSAVKAAVAALLQPGSDIQSSVSWTRSAAAIVMQESGVVKAAV
ncbi:hypothetical protein [Streptomyces sp. NPDC060198]|uniref:hypothetical protein n=1 Tax=Streptomyces sp. NPDC060198 TaxID=3347070 RepID=UPI0036653143